MKSELSTLKCEVCGRFISYEDLDKGYASHRMITPSSHVSSEEWETLCKEHMTRSGTVKEYIES